MPLCCLVFVILVILPSSLGLLPRVFHGQGLKSLIQDRKNQDKGKRSEHRNKLVQNSFMYFERLAVLPWMPRIWRAYRIRKF